MAFDDIIEKVEKIASEEVRNLDMRISDRAINTIIEDLREHQSVISEELVKKAAREYDVYESTRKLVKEASTYAVAAKRETVFANDIKEAMKNICPTYWPFC